ncbi:MAG: hypothetical protein CMK92_02625 [Pseudomonas sp.]|nr:hypothetical protein [Pseudomonas sp.]
MKRLLAKSILLAGGMSLTSQLYALGLGEMDLDSALNQPLRAEIELIDTSGLTSAEIKPRLASAQDFERAGVDRYQFLTQMKFSVNGDRILVTTRDPINEPFLNFLVELNWPAGRVLREYTVLLDPPVFEEGRVQPLVAVPAGTVTSVATATTAPRQTVPTQNARQNTGWTDPAAPGTYKVQPDDTLWQIALDTRPDSSISPQQMMIALQDVNPDAFINGNINRLKTHTVLDIPDASIIRTIAGREAVAEVQRQNKELTASVAQIDATGRQAVEPTAPKSTNGGEVRLLSSDAKGEAGQAGGQVSGNTGNTAAALENDLSIALENLDKSQRENLELAQRLEALEAQLAKMERLITLQNDQLANMQASKPAEAAGVSAPSEVATPAESVEAAAAADVAEANAPVASAADQAAQTPETSITENSDVANEPATDAVSEDAATDNATTEGADVAGAAIPESRASVTTDQNPEPQFANTPDYNYDGAAESDQAAAEQATSDQAEAATSVEDDMAARAAEEARKAAAAKSASPLDGIMGKITSAPMEWLTLGAGLLLMLVYALFKLRSRREEDAVAAAERDLAENGMPEGSELNDALDDLELPDAGDAPAFAELNDSLSESLDGEQGDGLTDDFDLGGDDALAGGADDLDLGDVDLEGYDDADAQYETVGQTEDAISESDIYIAYGKFDQAVDLLKGAIAAEPERVDLRLKLLEVQSSLDDAEAFAETETGLVALGDQEANAQAAELRAQLSHPIEPAAGDDALSLDGDLPSLDDYADEEFDGGLDFGDALDFGDDAKPEDDGIGASLETVPELELGESSEFDADAEGVDMTLEEEGVELNDELLNFDLEDDADKLDNVVDSSDADLLDSTTAETSDNDSDDLSFDLDAELSGVELPETELTSLDADESALDVADLNAELESLAESGDALNEETTEAPSLEGLADDSLEFDLESFASEDDEPASEPKLDELSADLDEVADSVEEKTDDSSDALEFDLGGIDLPEVSDDSTVDLDSVELDSAAPELTSEEMLSAGSDSLDSLDDLLDAGDSDETASDAALDLASLGDFDTAIEDAGEVVEPELSTSEVADSELPEADEAEATFDLDELSADAAADSLDLDAFAGSEVADLSEADTADVDSAESVADAADTEDDANDSEAAPSLDLADLNGGDDYQGLEELMSADAGDLAASSDLIGGIDLDELAAADDEFDFLAGTDECATKLDLARAYVDMEDMDGARELLQEVVQEGNDAQKQEAKDLLDTLA